jgi:hypothetical protein
MSPAIVDIFEMVEVDEDDRARLSIASGGDQRLRETLPEERPIRQSGEIIMGRLMRQLPFQHAPFG